MNLITKSNWRARVAIQSIRIAGRSPELMAEFRDAMLDRTSMRSSAAFALWVSRNMGNLVYRFKRHAADFRLIDSTCDNSNPAWTDFIIGQYIQDFPNN